MLPLLIAWDLGGLDLPLARLYGGAAGFALKEHWFTSGVMHDGARWLAWIGGLALVVNVWRPFGFARALVQRQRIWWLATTLGCVLLIPLLKQASLTSCPWSLAEFGGVARHVSHWAWGVADGGPGKCFPAGHAIAAFCFLPGWLALRRVAPRSATVWLVVTVVAGLGLGWAQMARGAHFASHTLWTGWFCWVFSLLSFHATHRWRASRASDRVRPA